MASMEHTSFYFSASVALAVFIIFLATVNRFILFNFTRLRGPPRKSFFFGETGYIRLSPDPKAIYKQWAKEYGPVYRIALPLGSEAIVVSDPKAVSQIFSRDTYKYNKTAGLRAVIERLVGRGMMWVEGDEHKRQRKTINPAFSSAVIKNMASVLFETTHRLKSAWEKILDSKEEGSKAEVELHDWMLKLLIDLVGRGLFDLEPHAIEGQPSSLLHSLQTFNATPQPKYEVLAYISSIFVPTAFVHWVAKISGERNRLTENVSAAARGTPEDLLEKLKNENETLESERSEKSLLRVLVDSEIGAGEETPESKELIIAQMKSILIAGPDPVAFTIVWTLIELARRLDIQDRLRIEVSASPAVEYDWKYLESSCPFLDAVVSEVLRLRPATGETPRVATEDDVLQLSEPIIDLAGNSLNQVFISMGTKIIIPNHYMNCSAAVWGPDSMTFNPDRWLDGSATTAEDGPTLRRLYTFGDGPRACIGRAFALVNLKIVLAILIRNFVFEFPNGPDTPIDVHFSLVAKPKVAGKEAAEVPMLISRAPQE